MTQYCPECGAGRNADGTFNVGRYFPIKDCPLCHERMLETARENGRKMAENLEKRLLDLYSREPIATRTIEVTPGEDWSCQL